MKVHNKSLTQKLLPFSFLALIPLAASSLAAEVAGGTINFNGSVVTTACAVSSNSANINVEMGQVRTAALSAAASEAPTAKKFSIVLEDCDSSVFKDVAVTFTGTPNNDDPSSLAVGSNGGTGTAQNVAVRLYSEEGTVVKLGETSNAVTLRDGMNTLNFGAKYYSPNGGATAGDASTVATYTLTYS
ncbi:fimbrial protein [Yersinia mollaretii]|uniref:P pilus assembly protein, pilin FimA n=1 Tax=Yersinia mollaretii (strain ATCC 43969 / DSM 18520 / CIP 103324 / CNY 7263 / WAIP 204) TaxID=349967 RepID=A0ABM9YAP3_YERMW|nr:fimbrial protein [Yersinia mollaretii]EEQ10901.1 P pilus assembly protein, pilin FimA [Yersinia mollaretii ATCC 43969]PJE87900.1 fimbrial protein [Yersinia mollaretii]QKJ02635.1 fimbrial protein [Yersinia mollaretii ATCC 43969]CQD41069.1 putative mannose-resistant/Proteus-like fimbrial protein [Yersinia mollaretii]CQH22055.1 putative mannose-resistant/Proteus-like fimbrial protein [Yersinia mollaretii]